MTQFEYKGQPVSLDELETRLLAPDEPDIAQAREAALRCSHRNQAWETLMACGLIPMEWATDERRAFGSDGALKPVPPSIEAAVRLAASASVVLTAEELAREAATRMEPWSPRGPGATPPAARTIASGFIDTKKRKRTMLGGPDNMRADLNMWVRAIGRAHRRELLEIAGEIAPPPQPLGVIARALAFFGVAASMPPIGDDLWAELHRNASTRGFNVLPSALWDVELAWTWDALARVRATTSSTATTFGFSKSLVNRSFGELPNPYEPRVSLWRLGCIPRRVTADRIGLATLTAEIVAKQP